MHKFRKKRVVLIVTSAALIGALSFSTLLSDFALGDDTQKINDLTKQQQNLQNQIKDTKNDLKNTTIEKNKQLNQLNQINSNIAAAQNTIDSLAASITETEITSPPPKMKSPTNSAITTDVWRYFAIV